MEARPPNQRTAQQSIGGGLKPKGWKKDAEGAPAKEATATRHHFAPGMAPPKGQSTAQPKTSAIGNQEKRPKKRKRDSTQQQKEVSQKRQRPKVTNAENDKIPAIAQPKQHKQRTQPDPKRKKTAQPSNTQEKKPNLPPNSGKRKQEAADIDKRPPKKNPVQEDPTLAGLSRRQKKKAIAERTKKKPIFEFGNNAGYYGYRNNYQPEDDPRLQILRPEWFAGRRCLDIGCNIGLVTVELARRFGCKTMVGVDIDAKLVARATSKLNMHKEKTVESSPEHKEEEAALTFPNNVTFRHGNILDDTIEPQTACYDVIVCFSVTKWVHLNWGDEGIRKLFAKVYSLLTDDGIFLLEPQQWSSYKKKAKLTPTIKENYKNIKLRPYFFKAELLEKVGFSSCEVIKDERLMNSGSDFALPVYVYRKGKTNNSEEKNEETDEKRGEKEDEQDRSGDTLYTQE